MPVAYIAVFILGVFVGSVISVPLYSLMAGTQSNNVDINDLYIVRVMEASTLRPFIDHLAANLKDLDIYIQHEAKGSLQIVREIKDLNKRADILVLVDSELVERELLDQEIIDWYIVLATSSIVLAYNDLENPAVNKIINLAEKGLWKEVFDLITSGEVRLGIANPDKAPQGYRTYIVLKLAGIKFYGDENYYIDRLNNLGRVLFVQSASALGAHIASGSIDVALTYIHDAVAQKLDYIELPEDLDLSNPRLNKLYSKASYRLPDGNTVYGRAIEIVLAVPRNTNRSSVVYTVLYYMLSTEFRSFLKSYGVNILDKPMLRGDPTELPKIIRGLVSIQPIQPATA